MDKEDLINFLKEIDSSSLDNSKIINTFNEIDIKLKKINESIDSYKREIFYIRLQKFNNKNFLQDNKALNEIINKSKFFKVDVLLKKRKSLDYKCKSESVSSSKKKTKILGNKFTDITFQEIDSKMNHNEPLYCYCNYISFGNMIKCDNDNVIFSFSVKRIGFTLNVLDYKIFQKEIGFVLKNVLMKQ